MRIVAIGEILWDVFPDAEHLGGAPFNFAAHARRLGHEVLFVSGVGDDERGRRARASAEGLGLSTRFVRVVPGQPTGTVTVRTNAAGQPSFTIHRPAAYDYAKLDAADLAELRGVGAGWVYFGTLQQMHPAARAATRALLDANGAAERFYDVNLRPDSYTPALVRGIAGDATVVKLNEWEVNEVGSMLGIPYRTPEQFSRAGAREFGWRAVCVTLGERGCALLTGDQWTEAPGYRVRIADTVGAGDAFAAAFLHGLDRGWDAREIGDFANRVGALVASRRGAIPRWTMDELVRARS